VIASSPRVVRKLDDIATLTPNHAKARFGVASMRAIAGQASASSRPRRTRTSWPSMASSLSRSARPACRSNAPHGLKFRGDRQPGQQGITGRSGGPHPRHPSTSSSLFSTRMARLMILYRSRSDPNVTACTSPEGGDGPYTRQPLNRRSRNTSCPVGVPLTTLIPEER
jgi:hypothetical protein